METARKIKQKGFSLMELMIALTIIGIIAVIGMKTMGNQVHEARRMKAFDVLLQVRNGLAEYNMKTGNYPEIGSWEAMVGANSPLLKNHLIRTDIPKEDPWGNPYEGKSTKGSFELKCAGRPDLGEELGPIIMNQDRTIGAPGSTPQKDSAAPATSESAPGQEP